MAKARAVVSFLVEIVGVALLCIGIALVIAGEEVERFSHRINNG